MSEDMHNFTHVQVAAVLPSEPDTALVDSLCALGDDVTVELAVGEQGIAHLDVDGSEHGWIASMKRTLQEEQGPISMLVDAMTNGRWVLFAHEVGDELVDDATTLLHDAGAELMFHFGEMKWRRLGG